MPANGHQRTVRGAAVTWYAHPDGSRRIARLGDVVTVSEDDLDRFDAAEASVPEPSLPVAQPVMPEPPRVGRGSGRDMWAAHADSLGVVFPEDATRDEIAAAVDAWRESREDDG